MNPETATTVVAPPKSTEVCAVHTLASLLFFALMPSGNVKRFYCPSEFMNAKKTTWLKKWPKIELRTLYVYLPVLLPTLDEKKLW